jgi:hypothetical protein
MLRRPALTSHIYNGASCDRDSHHSISLFSLTYHTRSHEHLETYINNMPTYTGRLAAFSLLPSVVATSSQVSGPAETAIPATVPNGQSLYDRAPRYTAPKASTRGGGGSMTTNALAATSTGAVTTSDQCHQWQTYDHFRPSFNHHDEHGVRHRREYPLWCCQMATNRLSITKRCRVQRKTGGR